MSTPEFKTDIDHEIDAMQAVADRLRAKIESDEAATVGYVKLHMLVIGCALSIFFGFCAGLVR